MFSTVRIEGYRGLREFEMSGLGRVNLLVGKNNCGKTSVLEALYLLYRKGERASLARVLEARGERVQDLPEGLAALVRSDQLSLDVSRLFSNTENRFAIAAQNSNMSTYIFVDNVERVIRITIDGAIAGEYPLSENGGFPIGLFQLSHEANPSMRSQPVKVRLIGTASASPEELVDLWGKIVLRPEETWVVKALQDIEPSVERIAPDTTAVRSRRGGFLVKLRNLEEPVPIGSLGEGMWRMLAIAIALTQSRGGALLIDEIDTGLHYSVLTKLWRLIYQTAQDLDVQVFATTHSQDCIRSFAELAEESPQNSSVSIQRIVQGKPKAVSYTPEEVAVLANQDIEVR